MKKFKKTALLTAYGAGTLTVAVLLLLAAGPRGVLFPEAMLPMDLRELAGAWLAIGFLPMVMVSMPLYRAVRRRAVLIPAGACLLAAVFWVGVWTLGMIRTPAIASGGDIVLPQAEKIESVRLTGSELDLTIGSGAFIEQLLHNLSQTEDTGRASVQDVPDQGAGVVRIDLNFRSGGTATVFLYRNIDGLMVEQPYQGIYRASDTLESWLREQIAAALAEEVKR